MTTPQCACATFRDGSKFTGNCPRHADTDPCLTETWITGKRRKGTITRRGICTNCGHRDLATTTNATTN